jgi:hypothetical protein
MKQRVESRQQARKRHHDAKDNGHVEDDEDEHADVARRRPFKAL